MWGNFFQYGNKVPDFDVLVLNEREARAAAGILFLVGLLSLLNALMIGNIIVTKYYLAFFTFDFLIRVVNPKYSPSMLLGRLFIQNQKPEYVGALQKRFAWSIGFFLSLPMFYYLVLNWEPSMIKILVCVFCLVLLFLEAAFSFCLGCWIYNIIMPEKSKNCPGGSCGLTFKDRVQQFNFTQKIIVTITIILLSYGLYAYLYHTENRTNFGEAVAYKFMSKEDLAKEKEMQYQRDLEEFEEEEF
ncbi:MAG: cbb3-type cytochrome oxidase subunit 3 [Sulfurimonas sp.]|jgi:cbb3-type cytochrome oxidase subunit 3|uniref:DUF4395 domain-containing protein n=1 Tax=Sulfurimonas sp. TaxID=2022749 RepID=UPI0039E3AEA0